MIYVLTCTYHTIDRADESTGGPGDLVVVSLSVVSLSVVSLMKININTLILYIAAY